MVHPHPRARYGSIDHLRESATNLRDIQSLQKTILVREIVQNPKVEQ